MLRTQLFAAGLFSAVSAMGADRVGAQAVVHSPQGPIEVIGLKRWTIRMLEDSLAAKAPGESLRSHACASILQQKLGFPAAAVSVDFAPPTNGGKPTQNVLITLIEPSDSARVQVRSVTGKRSLPSNAWGALRAATTDSSGFRLNDLLFVMQFYGVARTAPDSAAATIRMIMPDLVPVAQRIWAAVGTLTAPGDRAEALRTATGDPMWRNRVLAVSVLANFSSDDRAWHALAAAMRDSDLRVRDAAAAVLRDWSYRSARRVDWRPAQKDLRALLGGTNVWHYRLLLTALAKTEVAPSLAATLLGGNTEMLLAHLRASTASARTPAVELVQQLSGRSAMASDDALAWASAR